MIETALPSASGRPPSLGHSAPRRWRAAKETSPTGRRRRPCGQVGDVAFHGLGRQVQAAAMSLWRVLRQQRQHFGLLGVTSADKASGSPVPAGGGGVPGRRHAGGGIGGGGHRRWRRVEEREGRPANIVGSPTGREWPPRPPVGGHGGDTSRRGPVGVGVGEGLLGLCDPADPTRRRGVAHPSPDQPVHGQTGSSTSATAAGPSPRSRAGDAHSPAGGRDRGPATAHRAELGQGPPTVLPDQPQQRTP